MEVLIFTLFVLVSGLFGWFCGDVVATIKKGDSRRSWLGWLVLLLGILYMIIGDWQTRYICNHREYNYDKYEIVNDTTITNHDGQIDTLATFKIVKK